jgi:hypothetical protein
MATRTGPCQKCGAEKSNNYSKYCADCSVSCDEHDYYKKACRACHTAYQKAYPVAAKRKQQYQRKHKYGLTYEELAELESIQACEVCGETEDLVIDHNHDTREVRGVICRGCNTALGHAKDDPQILKSLAAYLEERGSYGGKRY